MTRFVEQENKGVFQRGGVSCTRYDPSFRVDEKSHKKYSASNLQSRPRSLSVVLPYSDTQFSSALSCRLSDETRTQPGRSSTMKSVIRPRETPTSSQRRTVLCVLF